MHTDGYPHCSNDSACIALYAAATVKIPITALRLWAVTDIIHCLPSASSPSPGQRIGRRKPTISISLFPLITRNRERQWIRGRRTAGAESSSDVRRYCSVLALPTSRPVRTWSVSRLPSELQEILRRSNLDDHNKRKVPVDFFLFCVTMRNVSSLFGDYQHATLSIRT